MQSNRSDELVQEIGRKIVNGKLVPGVILPKAEDLSRINGVSRTVVREILGVSCSKVSQI